MLTRSSRDHSRCPWAISAGNNESDGESDYENDKNGGYLLDHIRSTLDALEQPQQVNDLFYCFDDCHQDSLNVWTLCL